MSTNIRYITHTKKDKDRDIVALCNHEQSWSPVSKLTAIRDIKNRTYSYRVRWLDAQITEIKVVPGPNGEYLRTDRDNTTRNNLDDLPDC